MMKKYRKTEIILVNIFHIFASKIYYFFLETGLHFVVYNLQTFVSKGYNLCLTNQRPINKIFSNNFTSWDFLNSYLLVTDASNSVCNKYNICS